ncbi:MAG: flagellar basal body rod protein FlgC [Myxococcota bacterium]
MNVFSAMEIAASGLSAERTRMNVIASNLANSRTTQTEEGGPYRRMDPVFRAVPLADRVPEAAESEHANSAFLVEVPEIREDEGPANLMYDPTHPDANEDGFVEMPNINAVEEMVNMITATRAYEAGVTVMQTLKGMARQALSIGS